MTRKNEQRKGTRYEFESKGRTRWYSKNVSPKYKDEPRDGKVNRGGARRRPSAWSRNGVIRESNDEISVCVRSFRRRVTVPQLILEFKIP